MTKRWTNQQIQILIDKYGTTSVKDVALATEHSVNSVYIKASQLNLKKHYELNAIDRFMSKVVILNNNFNGTPCWYWLATKSDGYGRFRFGHVLTMAHKWFYEYLIGKVPQHLELDHLCRNRFCVNITHLEVVTSRENILRGTSLVAENARKTHCKRGHELIYDNVKIKKDGNRRCVVCDNLNNQRNKK